MGLEATRARGARARARAHRAKARMEDLPTEVEGDEEIGT